MATNNNELLIQNENLFRALVCAPVAVLFVLLAANSVTTSAIVVMQIVFVLLAVCFTLSSLAYASYYTNERSQGDAEPLIKNQNLSKSLVFLLLTILFGAIAYSAVTSSTHLIFKVISALLAIYFTLGTLAFAAYFTNDCCE
ncbi:hypothetical protein FE810_05630 [Thalassotalea litorea]|uniref:Uncharacterized protein n=1 Tax=Thalassotalea litorea TaxID=2020715 RepID=A0A5R9IQ81_9GAMM|nr:hypothetical protein [Thalassotalea litorea]TLU66197.1 hypothetical protein FE810_05630 [Thalassotalea litorea]